MLNIVYSESISMKDFEKKTIDEMKKSVEFLEKELLRIRTNRAHPSLVDGIKVEIYGQIMPLRAIAVITTPEAATINIQPFETKGVGFVGQEGKPLTAETKALQNKILDLAETIKKFKSKKTK
mgnify:CR=1 FL=1